MYKKRLKGYESVGYTVQRWNNNLNWQPVEYKHVPNEDLLYEFILEGKK